MNSTTIISLQRQLWILQNQNADLTKQLAACDPDASPDYFSAEPDKFDSDMPAEACNQLAEKSHREVLKSLEDFFAEEEAQAPPPLFHPSAYLEQFLERAWRAIKTASAEQFAGVNVDVSGMLKICVIEKNLPAEGRRILVASSDPGYPSAASFLQGLGATIWLGRPAGEVELASMHDVVDVLERGGCLSRDLKTYRKASGTLYLPTIAANTYLHDSVNKTFASLLRLDCSKTNLGVSIDDDYGGNLDELLMSLLEPTN